MASFNHPNIVKFKRVSILLIIFIPPVIRNQKSFMNINGIYKWINIIKNFKVLKTKQGIFLRQTMQLYYQINSFSNKIFA
jgi:hypothetical protein